MKQKKIEQHRLLKLNFVFLFFFCFSVFFWVFYRFCIFTKKKANQPLVFVFCFVFVFVLYMVWVMCCVFVDMRNLKLRFCFVETGLVFVFCMFCRLRFDFRFCFYFLLFQWSFVFFFAALFFLFVLCHPKKTKNKRNFIEMLVELGWFMWFEKKVEKGMFFFFSVFTFFFTDFEIMCTNNWKLSFMKFVCIFFLVEFGFYLCFNSTWVWWQCQQT